MVAGDVTLAWTCSTSFCTFIVFSYIDLLFSLSLSVMLGGTHCSHRPPSATGTCLPLSLRPKQQKPWGYIWWWQPGRSCESEMAVMWKVCPDICQGQQLFSAVHLDLFLHGAHLLQFSEKILLINLDYSDSLDTFADYCINHFTDHHSRDILSIQYCRYSVFTFLMDRWPFMLACSHCFLSILAFDNIVAWILPETCARIQLIARSLN